MILVLTGRELAVSWRSWVWTGLVAGVGGACLASILHAQHTFAAAASSTASPHDFRGLAAAIGGQLLAYVLLAVAAVVASTAGLTISGQARSHALLKVLGLGGLRLRLIVLTQLAIVGAAGGALGAALSLLLAPHYLATWVEIMPAAAHLSTSPDPAAIPWAGALAAAATVAGGSGAARRAAGVSEMQALRENEAPRARIGRLSLGLAVLAGICLALLWIIRATVPSAAHGPTAIPLPALAGISSLMLVTIALLLPSLTLTPFLRGWTGLVPDRAVWWLAAREACRHRATQSTATVLPFAVAVAISGVLFSMAGPSPTGRVSGFWVIFVLIFAVSAAGGFANIALVGGRRRHDQALLDVLGASRAHLFLARLAEGVLYAMTGVLFGLGVTVLTVALECLASGASMIWRLARLPWLDLGAISAGCVVLAVTAVLTSAGTAGQRPPQEILRQPV